MRSIYRLAFRLSRTLGPPPLSAIKTTPAFSGARRKAARLVGIGSRISLSKYRSCPKRRPELAERRRNLLKKQPGSGRDIDSLA